MTHVLSEESALKINELLKEKTTKNCEIIDSSAAIGISAGLKFSNCRTIKGGQMNYIAVLVTLLLYFICWFLIATSKKNYGLIDIAWGGGFVLTAVVSYLFSPRITIQNSLILVLVILWGVRLAIHLGRRN